MFTGERVYLRSYDKKDIPSILKFINDPEVNRNLAPGIPYPMDTLAEEKWIEQQSANREKKSFAILLKQTDEYMGGCGINDIDWKNRFATLGIFLGKPFWNQGYGTEAFGILINFIFSEMNMNKVKLFVYSFNQRAIRSYEKCGFRVEGVLRQEIFRDGQYFDQIAMGLLFSEWKERKTASQPKLL
jgi:RimJ/RimL family protein N-acetyltransferase